MTESPIISQQFGKFIIYLLIYLFSILIPIKVIALAIFTSNF